MKETIDCVKFDRTFPIWSPSTEDQVVIQFGESLESNQSVLTEVQEIFSELEIVGSRNCTTQSLIFSYSMAPLHKIRENCFLNFSELPRVKQLSSYEFLLKKEIFQWNERLGITWRKSTQPSLWLWWLLLAVPC